MRKLAAVATVALFAVIVAAPAIAQVPAPAPPAQKSVDGPDAKAKPDAKAAEGPAVKKVKRKAPVTDATGAEGPAVKKAKKRIDPRPPEAPPKGSEKKG